MSNEFYCTTGVWQTVGIKQQIVLIEEGKVHGKKKCLHLKTCVVGDMVGYKDEYVKLQVFSERGPTVINMPHIMNNYLHNIPIERLRAQPI